MPRDSLTLWSGQRLLERTPDRLLGGGTADDGLPVIESLDRLHEWFEAGAVELDRDDDFGGAAERLIANTPGYGCCDKCPEYSTR